MFNMLGYILISCLPHINHGSVFNSYNTYLPTFLQMDTKLPRLQLAHVHTRHQKTQTLETFYYSNYISHLYIDEIYIFDFSLIKYKNTLSLGNREKLLFSSPGPFYQLNQFSRGTDCPHIQIHSCSSLIGLFSSWLFQSI